MLLFSRSSKSLIAAGLLLPVVLIGIPAMLVSRAESQVKTSFGWVAHTFEVQTAVQRLVNSLVDAETGQRGYLLTQKRIYLESYEAGRPRVERDLRDLKASAAANEWQQQRLNEIEPLIAERLKLLEGTIALEERGEHDAAVELVKSDRGKNTMDRIRSIARAVAEEEQRLLRTRQQQLSQHARRSTILLRTLVAMSVLCGLGIFYLLQRLSEVQPIVNMCAYSRTIEHDGEWLSFEQYLQRRFNIATSTSHGLSPAEFERLRAARTGPAAA